MIVRELRLSDIPEVDRIFKKQTIGVPSLANSVANRVVFNGEDKAIAYGVVKLFGEAVLIMDQTINRKSKVEVLRELMKLAIDHSREYGLEYLHTISNSESFTKVLCKQYQFRSCPGDLLILDLNPDKDGKDG